MMGSDDCPTYACCLGRSKDEDDSEPKRPITGLNDDSGHEAPLLLDVEMPTSVRTTGPLRAPRQRDFDVAGGSHPALKSQFLLQMRTPAPVHTNTVSSSSARNIDLEKELLQPRAAAVVNSATRRLTRTASDAILPATSLSGITANNIRRSLGPAPASNLRSLGIAEDRFVGPLPNKELPPPGPPPPRVNEVRSFEPSPARGNDLPSFVAAAGDDIPSASPDHQHCTRPMQQEDGACRQDENRRSARPRVDEDRSGAQESSSGFLDAGLSSSNDEDTEVSSNYSGRSNMRNSINSSNSNSSKHPSAAQMQISSSPFTPLVSAAAKLLGLGSGPEETPRESERQQHRQRQPETAASAPRRSARPSANFGPRGSMTAPQIGCKGGVSGLEGKLSFQPPGSAPPAARVVEVSNPDCEPLPPAKPCGQPALGTDHAALFRDLPLPLHSTGIPVGGHRRGSDTSDVRTRQYYRLDTPGSEYHRGESRSHEPPLLVPDTPGSGPFGQFSATRTPGNHFGTAKWYQLSSGSNNYSSNNDENNANSENCKDLDSISVCTTTKSWVPYTPGNGAFGLPSPGLRDISQPSTQLPQPDHLESASGHRRYRSSFGSTVALLTPISVETQAPEPLIHPEHAEGRLSTKLAVEMRTPESVMTEAFCGQQNSKDPDREDALEETVSSGSQASSSTQSRTRRPSLVARLFG
mmetsp:Transcript_13494/g.29782  ORF Transcript_13494/g.29782 Transcript_13494/m.29782 type:complete len:695 (-) Transcript_13494:32-2116(-)|eukprot:CAMPEP_0206461036 /NCGR_PEP_ID=MMETSP0324_2-20121206/25105_1 /ASSEMBLY_ACC=CAM_ASM_000836 /TAXON_ID=2866 /ORGANISM="Crypthecodinium cohnii, Strain Seligo" /LENGTH=694 /DNA_ID=CAMNT_0053932847 /DNA_START=461 /DNA_END=2542 /DNA_ORIENTATION=-